MVDTEHKCQALFLTLHVYYSFFPMTTLRGRYCCCPHFTDEDVEVELRLLRQDEIKFCSVSGGLGFKPR